MERYIIACLRVLAVKTRLQTERFDPFRAIATRGLIYPQCSISRAPKKRPVYICRAVKIYAVDRPRRGELVSRTRRHRADIVGRHKVSPISRKTVAVNLFPIVDIIVGGISGIELQRRCARPQIAKRYEHSARTSIVIYISAGGEILKGRAVVIILIHISASLPEKAPLMVAIEHVSIEIAHNRSRAHVDGVGVDGRPP